MIKNKNPWPYKLDKPQKAIIPPLVKPQIDKIKKEKAIKNQQAGAMAQEPMYVFVYGTLKRGFGNHESQLGGCARIASTSIRGELYDLGQFPAAVSVPDAETIIIGEIYNAYPQVMERLDKFEGVPNFYKRTKVMCDAGVPVWAYLMDKQDVVNFPLIKDGLWK